MKAAGTVRFGLRAKFVAFAASLLCASATVSTITTIRSQEQALREHLRQQTTSKARLIAAHVAVALVTTVSSPS